MIRSVILAAVLMVLIAVAAKAAFCQSNRDLQTFFKHDIGLTKDQIAAIRSGQPVVKALLSRTPSEVFLFGAIYIHAAPESYIQFARDFDRRRELPSYWGLQVFSDPPNRLLQKTALQRLLAYQQMGNEALGLYNDKRDPTVVPQQFAYMLSYSKALPAHLPEFYTYLLAYPNAKPANVEDTFYWARVKFGLKPTLRVVQMVIMRGNLADPVACAIAEKQLYSSHYFETALDLSFCIRESDDPKQPGFYLIIAMGSEQAGLNMNMMNTTFLLGLSPVAELRLILMLFLFPAEWGALLFVVALFEDVKRALRRRKTERGGRHA